MIIMQLPQNFLFLNKTNNSLKYLTALNLSFLPETLKIQKTDNFELKMSHPDWPCCSRQPLWPLHGVLQAL